MRPTPRTLHVRCASKPVHPFQSPKPRTFSNRSLSLSSSSISTMNPSTDKLVRRTTMVATVVAGYFLLTADYGPEPNVLDPIKSAIQSGEQSVKNFFFGSKQEVQEGKKPTSDTTSEKHP